MNDFENPLERRYLLSHINPVGGGNSEMMIAKFTTSENCYDIFHIT